MADEEDLRRAREGEIDLAQSDLRQADLSGWDLSGRDFTGAHLEHAVAHGANFTQATLNKAELLKLDANGSNFSTAIAVSTVFYGVNFRGCNFSGGEFSRSHFSKTNLDGANFSGADFRDAYFNEGTSLEGAYADEAARFDGATVFRPLAREPVFRFYRIERGRLVRLTKPAEQSEQPLRQDLLREAPSEPVRALSAAVRQRIAQRPMDIAVMAAALSQGINDQVADLAAAKPNEPRALEAHETYISFLRELSSGLRDIHTALTVVLQSPEDNKKQEQLSRSARIAEELGNKLETWITANGQILMDFGFKTAFLGAGTAFLSFCGVPSVAAFIAAASSISGGSFLDGVKEWMKSSGTRKRSAPKKR